MRTCRQEPQSFDLCVCRSCELVYTLFVESWVARATGLLALIVEDGGGADGLTGKKNTDIKMQNSSKGLWPLKHGRKPTQYDAPSNSATSITTKSNLGWYSAYRAGIFFYSYLAAFCKLRSKMLHVICAWHQNNFVLVALFHSNKYFRCSQSTFLW